MSHSSPPQKRPSVAKLPSMAWRMDGPLSSPPPTLPQPSPSLPSLPSTSLSPTSPPLPCPTSTPHSLHPSDRAVGSPHSKPLSPPTTCRAALCLCKIFSPQELKDLAPCPTPPSSPSTSTTSASSYPVSSSYLPGLSLSELDLSGCTLSPSPPSAFTPTLHFIPSIRSNPLTTCHNPMPFSTSSSSHVLSFAIRMDSVMDSLPSSPVSDTPAISTSPYHGSDSSLSSRSPSSPLPTLPISTPLWMRVPLALGLSYFPLGNLHFLSLQGVKVKAENNKMISSLSSSLAAFLRLLLSNPVSRLATLLLSSPIPPPSPRPPSSSSYLSGFGSRHHPDSSIRSPLPSCQSSAPIESPLVDDNFIEQLAGARDASVPSLPGVLAIPLHPPPDDKSSSSPSSSLSSTRSEFDWLISEGFHHDFFQVHECTTDIVVFATSTCSNAKCQITSAIDRTLHNLQHNTDTNSSRSRAGIPNYMSSTLSSISLSLSSSNSTRVIRESTLNQQPLTLKRLISDPTALSPFTLTDKFYTGHSANSSTSRAKINHSTRSTSTSLSLPTLKCRPFFTLECLSLDNAQSLTDAALLSLAKRCPSLRFLSLSGCTCIGDSALIPMTHSGPGTTRLAGYSSGRSPLCPLLQDLRLARTRITDKGIVSCAGGIAPIVSSWVAHPKTSISPPQLQSIYGSLLRSIDVSGCHITDTSCRALAARCPYLLIVIAQSTQITVEGVAALLACISVGTDRYIRRPLPTLPALATTPNQIEPSIRRLDITHASRISHNQIDALVKLVSKVIILQ